MIYTLEIKTLIVFDWCTKTILSPFFFFFFIKDFLIHAVIAQILILTAELVMPTGTQTNKAIVETWTEPVTVEAKTS